MSSLQLSHTSPAPLMFAAGESDAFYEYSRLNSSRGIWSATLLATDLGAKDERIAAPKARQPMRESHCCLCTKRRLLDRR